MQNLSSDELLLLKKLGIKLPRERKARSAEPEWKSTKLDDFSGKITRTCKCCGNIETKFIDYVKRVDCEGFTIVTVETPAHAVTREHIQDVINCAYCADRMLVFRDTSELVKMVLNLRKELRKGGA